MIEGWVYWHFLKLKYGINYHKVVLVLSGDDIELDKACISFLPYFMERKYAKDAIILYSQERYSKEKIGMAMSENCKAYPLKANSIKVLYCCYCFFKFFDNIVFTYIDDPEDNKLGQYLRETEVNAVDAACLALYHLRCIPKRDMGIQ